jgi:hypothetical protein
MSIEELLKPGPLPERWIKLSAETREVLISRALPYDENFVNRLLTSTGDWSKYVVSLFAGIVPRDRGDDQWRRAELYKIGMHWLPPTAGSVLDTEPQAPSDKLAMKSTNGCIVFINVTGGKFSVSELYARVTLPD